MWGARATAAVKRLGDISDDGGVKRFPADDCDYRGKETTRIYKWGDDVRLRTVAANVALTETDEGMVKNGSSAVVAVELGKFSIILPGDATWETMMFINNRVYGPKNKGPKPGTCIALSVPHHGSLRTAVEGYGPKRQFNKMNTSVVKAFAGNIKSQTVIASAGFQNSHHHPMTEIMEEFAVKIRTNSNNKHAWMGFDFTSDKWRDFPNVEKNLFTTVTTVTTIANPPVFYNGVYTLTATGQATFDLVAFHPATLRKQVVYHADLYEALADDGDPAAPAADAGA